MKNNNIKTVFLLFLLLIGLNFKANAQNDITLIGYIFDEETKQALPYVNIGFVEKTVGTVSDEKGKFTLTYKSNKINFDNVLQISSLGYETIKLKASNFYVSIAKSNKIYLKPSPFNLEEVVLSPKQRRFKLAGSLRRKENSIGYWLNSEALGGEIATKINIKHKNSKLHHLKFYVVKNNSGNIKIRINVYDIKNGFPNKNLLTKNIYHTISKPFGEEIIDLEAYNIIVSDNIIVSLELIQVFGKYIDFELAAARFKGVSFTRHLSQDKWKKYDNLMAFGLKTSYPIDRLLEDDIIRELPNRITLYWDTSLSMKNRLIGKELDLLSSYLKKVKNAEIEVVKFSTTTLEPKQFQIKKGRSSELLDYLQDTNYEGVSSYANIVTQNNFNADTVLLFTDGNSVFTKLQPEINALIFSINTLSKANHLQLQKASFYADGHYINLKEQSLKSALELLLNEMDDTIDYTTKLIKENEFINGTVTSNNSPIQSAIIRLKNSFVEIQTDVEGKYKINAKEDDVLVVNYLGMLEKEILVSNINKIDIQLEPDGEVLDEIFLEGKVKKEKVIDTPYGEKSFDAVGYAFDELKKEDINSGITTLDQVVTKLPGVVIMGYGNDKRYFFARNLSKKGEVPAIIIDDIIYTQSNGLDRLPPIDMQTIQSVKAIKSVIGTNRYGGAAAYGAIIIKTQFSATNLQTKTSKPSALITGNDYQEELSLIITNYKNPSYIKELENAVSYNNALTIYKKQNTQKSIPYYLNVSNYFKRWNKGYALSILSNIAEIAYNNPKALKTLAYKLEEFGKLQEAKHIYQRIAALRPKAAQTYRDLALIYQQTGDYKDAMTLYGQMLNNNIKGVDFTGLENVIKSELQHLLKKHRSKVDYSNVHADYLKADFKYDLRIVFNWNDPNTEFEVQFVNPKNKYFKWQQTKLDNRERMLDGITKGYHTEEFIIDEDEIGEWLINIEALNNEAQLNPTYLKYTVFRNYGLANETKEVKVINLNKFKPKVTFDKLLNN